MKEKIMVVDDEFEVADIVKKMLESEGYNVVVANSGIEALDIVEGEQPDLILLDILMPGMDGWETLRQLKLISSIKDTAVSMLTALPLTPEDTQDKPIDNIENYIVKPFTKQILLQKIQDILEKKKEIINMYDTIKHNIGEKEAEEYKRLSLAVNRHRRLVGVIVDSTVSELRDSVKNLLVSQKRMIETMNKKIAEIEEQVTNGSGS